MDLFLYLQFPRSAAKSHSQTQIESHLSLALCGLEETQHQVHELVTVVKEQSQRIERQSQQIERQSQQIERQSQQIEKMISKDKKQSETMERPMSTAQDQPLQGEQRGSMKSISTPFEWRISLNQAVSVSEPFYLFKGGYKYMLKSQHLYMYLGWKWLSKLKLFPENLMIRYPGLVRKRCVL